MAEVKMPKLSDTMEEGKLLRWLKRQGEHVEAGEILAEVETDKADMELEASVGGEIRELRLSEGESAAVGAVIAVIESGADGDGGAQAEPAPAKGGRAQAKGDDQAPSPDEPGEEAATADPPPREPAPERPRATAGAGQPPRGEATGGTARRAPPARESAGSTGSTAPQREGSQPTPPRRSDGPGIVRVRPPAAAGAARVAAAPVEGAAVRMRRVPLSRMRASIARRMAESKREAPHFYLTTVANMDDAVRLRASIRDAVGAGDRGVTYNHMVLKACADALAVFPEMNARFAGDAIEIAEEVNLGVATAREDGLLVPVIHNADRLSLFELAARARALGERAEAGGFSGADLSGATFSVSNLGMFGVDSFAAVINPPQAGILAVGSVELRPVVRDGAIVPGHTMSMTLSCDHRVVDGAQGARFLAEVRRRLENPLLLLIIGAPES